MAPTKLRVGCAGLGRMGKRHALHFLERTPRAELVAASSPDDEELKWAKVHLEPFGVKLYKNYDDMLKHEGLEAVVVASATAVHAEQAIKAIEAEKHVLCEKPLSTNVEIVRFLYAINGKKRWLTDDQVPNCRGCSCKEATPEGNVWFLSSIRCFLPRRIPEDAEWSHRTPIRGPQPDLRQA